MTNPMDFLAAVTGAAQAAADTSSATRPIRLATVDPAYEGLPTLPRVTFDGETTLSGKRYALLQGYVPAAGDRVALAPVGTTYVILGPLWAGSLVAPEEGEKVKTAIQDRTNSTVLVDDDTLFFPVVPGGVYRADWEIMYSSDSAADFKIALTWPSGTGPWGYYGTADNMVMRAVGFDNAISSGTPFVAGGNGAAATLLLRITATISVGVTGGNVRFQFAQNTAVSGQSARVRPGSRLTWKRVG